MCPTARVRFTRYWLPVIGWAAVILVGTSLPQVPGPDIEGGDKVAHLLAYAVLGALLARAWWWGERVSGRRWALLTIAYGGLFGVIDELHQMPLPTRTASVGDLMADIAGLIIGVVVVGAWVMAHRPEVDSTQGRP